MIRLKTNINFATFVLTLCAISSLFMANETESKEFCSNSEQVANVFSMHKMTYLGKGNVFYFKLIEEKFAGKTSTDPKDIFKIDFKSVKTGFVVSAIPFCSDTVGILSKENEKCGQLKRLENLGFVIGVRALTTRQSYVSYGYHLNDSNSLYPITDDKDMPFGMKPQDEIVENAFWPRSSDNNIIYLASTYDRMSYALVHLIQEQSDLVLYIRYLSDETNEWKLVRNPRVYPMNDSIISFKGFVQIEDPNSTKLMNTYALVELEPTTETLLEFDSNYNPDIEFQRNFLPQVAVDLTVDVYGCKDNIMTTDYKQITESDIEETSYTSQGNKEGNDLTNPDEVSILFHLLIGFIIIAFILLIALLITFLYIRQINDIQKPKTKKEKIFKKK